MLWKDPCPRSQCGRASGGTFTYTQSSLKREGEVVNGSVLKLKSAEDVQLPGMTLAPGRGPKPSFQSPRLQAATEQEAGESEVRACEGGNEGTDGQA